MSVKTRAKRFGIQMDLRYRLSGESKWRKGTTENISFSGVLFQAEESAKTSTPLEIRLELPAEILGVGCAEVDCKGIVIRSEGPKGAGAGPTLASTIARYRFIRP